MSEFKIRVRRIEHRYAEIVVSADTPSQAAEDVFELTRDAGWGERHIEDEEIVTVDQVRLVCKRCGEEIDVNYGAEPGQAEFIHIEDHENSRPDYDHDAEPP